MIRLVFIRDNFTVAIFQRVALQQCYELHVYCGLQIGLGIHDQQLRAFIDQIALCSYQCGIISDA